MGASSSFAERIHNLNILMDGELEYNRQRSAYLDECEKRFGIQKPRRRNVPDKTPVVIPPVAPPVIEVAPPVIEVGPPVVENVPQIDNNVAPANAIVSQIGGNVAQADRIVPQNDGNGASEYDAPIDLPDVMPQIEPVPAPVAQPNEDEFIFDPNEVIEPRRTRRRRRPRQEVVPPFEDLPNIHTRRSGEIERPETVPDQEVCMSFIYTLKIFVLEYYTLF